MRDHADYLANEFSSVALRLLKKRNVHRRIEDAKLLVDEERRRSAEFIRRLPRAVAENISEARSLAERIQKLVRFLECRARMLADRAAK